MNFFKTSFLKNIIKNYIFNRLDIDFNIIFKKTILKPFNFLKITFKKYIEMNKKIIIKLHQPFKKNPIFSYFVIKIINIHVNFLIKKINILKNQLDSESIAYYSIDLTMKPIIFSINTILKHINIKNKKILTKKYFLKYINKYPIISELLKLYKLIKFSFIFYNIIKNKISIIFIFYNIIKNKSYNLKNIFTIILEFIYIIYTNLNIDNL